MFHPHIDADLKLSNYPKLLLQFAGWVVFTAVLAFVGSFGPGILLLVGVFTYLTLYRPKLFLLAVVMYYMLYHIFVMQQLYAGWGVSGGLGRGNMGLRDLRRIHPGAPSMHHVDKIFLFCILLRLVPPALSNPNRYKLTPIKLFLFLFLVSILLSAVANLTFNKTVARFFYQFSMGILLYIYGTTLKFSLKERQWMFATIFFAAVEGQIIFSVLNNLDEFFKGKIFFGDHAIGTFVHPYYENSAYLLTIAFFYFLYSFLIRRKFNHVLRALVALYGILSISVVLFTLILGAFTLVSFFYVTSIGVLKPKELILAIFAMLILSGPVYLVFFAEDSSSGTSDHMAKHMAKNEQREWWEIPKIYSYVNLYNMMDNERRWFFGAGPGNFLTRFGNGPLNQKYRSFTIFKTTQLSSSEMVENSTVGIIGDIGLHGFIFYIGMWIIIMREALRLNKRKKEIVGESDAFCTMVVVVFLFYFLFAMLRNLYETRSLMTILGVLPVLGFQHVEEIIRVNLNQKTDEIGPGSEEEPLPDPLRPSLTHTT